MPHILLYSPGQKICGATKQPQSFEQKRDKICLPKSVFCVPRRLLCCKGGEAEVNTALSQDVCIWGCGLSNVAHVGEYGFMSRCRVTPFITVFF